jgi:hypothetical protein
MSKKRKTPSADAVARFRKAWIRERDYEKYGHDESVEDEFGRRIAHQPAVARGGSASRNGKKKPKS